MKIFLTVDVEEWFHTNWFDYEGVIKKYYDGKEPETDVLDTTKELIDLFDNYGAKATFFLLGETAFKYPELIDILEESQHELACHGFYHNKIYSDNEEFHKDVKRFKKEVKYDVQGFRFSNFGYNDEKLKILVKEGFSYDSSIVPCLNIPRWYGNSKSPINPYKLDLGDEISITEFPISVLPYLRLPGAGGWYIRNLGYQWTKNVIKYSLKKTNYGMIYMHPWEFSSLNPQHIKDIKSHVFRNSGERNLNSLKKLIEEFSEGSFMTISDELNLKKIK